MKLIIKKVDNGYIIRTLEGESIHLEIKDVLHEILDYFGESGSRHDEKRIYIIERPGDKHSDFTEEDYKALWGTGEK